MFHVALHCRVNVYGEGSSELWKIRTVTPRQQAEFEDEGEPRPRNLLRP